MSVTTTDPDVAIVRLRRARRVLIIGHQSPDGDSLGSQLALAELAETLGISAVVANCDPAPAGLHELPGYDRVVVGRELPPDFPQGFDLVATMECSELERCGFERLDELPILNIDHHKANREYGELNFNDQESPAVGEMVWLMFRSAEVEPSPSAATNMYVALATDTGDFRYPNATPRAFMAATGLVAAGASPEQVAEWVHERRSPSNIRLLGEALQTLTLWCDDQLATMAVDRHAFDRAAATPADTEEIINVPRSIAGVRAVAFFKEWEPGKIRISLRSKGNLDVCQVALKFTGGGHTNAAGCTVKGSLSDVRRQITTELIKMLEEKP
jgi:phosphoesterase RecJ-like protein